MCPTITAPMPLPVGLPSANFLKHIGEHLLLCANILRWVTGRNNEKNKWASRRDKVPYHTILSRLAPKLTNWTPKCASINAPTSCAADRQEKSNAQMPCASAGVRNASLSGLGAPAPAAPVGASGRPPAADPHGAGGPLAAPATAAADAGAARDH